MKLRLYHYWRSSSSWRVRWAFAIKGISCEFQSINLLTDEPESEAHLARNPLGFVPVLELIDSPGPIHFIAESNAILEWANEAFPAPGLFPSDLVVKARARQLAEIINSGTQPLQNPTVAARHSPDPEEQKKWNQFWIRRGFRAFETLVQETYGGFSVGNALSLPDLYLIPQCYNAERNGVGLDEFPTISKIYAAALMTDTCQASHPDRFKP